MLNGISKCQFESTESMPELPDEESALALARLDGILAKLQKYRTEGSEDNGWKECYHNVLKADVSVIPQSDLKDFELVMRVFDTVNGSKVAAWREQAFRDGESCEEISDKGYNPDDVDSSVTQQLSVAKENGFALPLICNILFQNVGLEQGSRQTIDIPRFFNRVLGWRLACQEVVTNLFYNTLRAVIREAKRQGKFDLGIKNFSGREIQFEGPPRCFRFGGIDAPDEALLLYNVKVDSGIPADLAKELYEDAMKEISSFGSEENEDGWLSTGRRGQIRTGFYIDRRKSYKATPKIFLVINQSSVSLDKRLMVVRPNLGRRYREVADVYDKIYNQRLWKPCDVDKALKIWKKEFELANCSRKHFYQFSCPGRHSKSVILSVSHQFVGKCGHRFHLI